MLTGILTKFSRYSNPRDNTTIKRLCQIISNHPSIKTFEYNYNGCGGEGGGGVNTQTLHSIMDAGKNKLIKLALASNDIKSGEAP